MFICIFAEVLNQININIMSKETFYLNQICRLESANQNLHQQISNLQHQLNLLKLEKLKKVVFDPAFDKPISEINVNYEIVKPC
jgi:hypothetical protein